MPQGQYEAAKILGYTKAQTFIRIILPQVIKRILPAITNETITLVKDTSLAFTIGVTEMFTMAKALASGQVSMLPYAFAALFYYILNLVVAFIMERIVPAYDVVYTFPINIADGEPADRYIPVRFNGNRGNFGGSFGIRSLPAGTKEI